jgi:competence protein ComEA
MRAVAATTVLFALLLAARWLLATTWAPPGSPGHRTSSGGPRVCFAVAGASARPGVRCVPRPDLLDVAAEEPCAGAATLRRIHELLVRCPLHGRRLVLAPARSGGPCIPRLESLPAAQRAMLGIPLDLASATAADLEVLPGVGPRTARAILAVRDRAGRAFDLADVPGLGPVRQSRLRRVLAFEPPLPPGCAGLAR